MSSCINNQPRMVTWCRATRDPLWALSFIQVRYGVVANIVVSHTTAGGSIPPIGVIFAFLLIRSRSFIFLLSWRVDKYEIHWLRNLGR
ncbi:uncharacterized protein N7503_010100 [Penicillium pulvis]|uniref:uncharacterized protein n=1 Tax=Penicillium pulvis TaxID=1562058 RepID=UPI00254803F9|nr:uncharacterized protein N7503_010100 [Penicillium pulvis]KAJ5784888.1 hypothetical protein N7503_010100 [Penicillium pulvis]